jgi:bifunctional non-homologous end joining protein LigD
MIDMPLPSVPMAPVTSSDIPIGPEWGYQIKWDGVRTLARLDGIGGVEIFGKRLEPRNHTFPEIAELLKPARIGACLLDGEIAYFDGKRPNFQRGRRDGLLFVIFDQLYDKGKDIRGLSYQERYNRLKDHFPERQPRLFVSDLFSDGQALWEWVEEREWEGIISKRLASPYTEGKNHQDWFKKRKALRLAADVVGIKLKEGRVSSLVLRYENRYIGHVSLGLDNASKQVLQQLLKDQPGTCPFPSLSPGMKKSDIAWLGIPFKCRVTALEFTNTGLLRHPKLLGFGDV